MQILPQIEAFLRDAMGLRSDTLSASGITGAVRERMRACRLTEEPQYLALLESSPQEQQALIERVVVPETWFFRDDQPFEAVKDYVRQGWPGRQTDTARLRVLSAPCSTGEEPYSLAMTLLELGLPPARWQIDAVDISRAALARAEQGHYGRHSFRSRDLAFRDRYFRPVNQHYVLDETVRRAVRFEQGNVIDPDFLHGRPCYDLIFFRNLMIYLGEAEQERALASLDRLLCPAGLLFIGHAEPSPLLGRWFVPAGYPGAFAYRKHGASPAVAKPPPAAPRPRSVRPASPPPTLRPAPRPQSRSAPESAPTAATVPVTADTVLAEARRKADGGQLAEARRLCETLLDAGSPQAAAYHLLGLIHDAGGDAVAAEACFRKALYLDPGHAEALFHLALAAERRGDAAAARRFRERAQRQERRQSGVTA